MNLVQLLSMATVAYRVHYWACSNRVKSDIFICSCYFIVQNSKICNWYLILCANLVQLNQHQRLANKSLKNVFANKAFYGFGYNKTPWNSLITLRITLNQNGYSFWSLVRPCMYKMDPLGTKICNLSLPRRNRCKLI